MPRITLVGYRGTGKSTVAAWLGRLLGCGWHDADEVLEKKLGCSITTLVRGRGEAAFRDAEAAVLVELLGSCDGVLSTGGGVVLRPDNRAMLRTLGRPIIWLTAAADVVHRRIQADPGSAERRPPLAGTRPGAAADPLAEVTEALAVREALYRECADLTIDTSLEPPEAVARRIIAWLDEAWPRLQGTSSVPPDNRTPPSDTAAGGRS